MKDVSLFSMNLVSVQWGKTTKSISNSCLYFQESSRKNELREKPRGTYVNHPPCWISFNKTWAAFDGGESPETPEWKMAAKQSEIWFQFIWIKERTIRPCYSSFHATEQNTYFHPLEHAVMCGLTFDRKTILSCLPFADCFINESELVTLNLKFLKSLLYLCSPIMQCEKVVQKKGIF